MNDSAAIGVVDGYAVIVVLLIIPRAFPMSTSTRSSEGLFKLLLCLVCVCAILRTFDEGPLGRIRAEKAW